MIRLIAIIFLFFLSPIFIIAQKANITIEVSDVKPSASVIRVGVFDKTHKFMTKTDPCLKDNKPASDSVVVFQFKDVPNGRYAIALYHDENNDEKLNTKKLGIPVEGIGFSGKFNSRIKPPDFRLASFRLKSDTIISIRLIYNKRD